MLIPDESQNLVAALPLLEKVALAYPNDPVVLSRLGFTLYANSTDEKDVTKRAQMRLLRFGVALLVGVKDGEVI